MKGFSQRPRARVTFRREDTDETLVLQLVALPASYAGYLGTVFPPPTEWVNGKEVEKDRGDYDDLQAYLLLARGLEEPALEAKRDAYPTWAAYAKAVREEIIAANLTEGEVARLVRVLLDLATPDVTPSGN